MRKDFTPVPGSIWWPYSYVYPLSVITHPMDVLMYPWAILFFYGQDIV